MPTKASESKKGIQMNAGRKSGGRGVTSPGLSGDGTTTTPLGRAHGNNGRDERSAANMADDGNRVVGAPTAHGHNYK